MGCPLATINLFLPCALTLISIRSQSIVTPSSLSTVFYATGRSRRSTTTRLNPPRTHSLYSLPRCTSVSLHLTVMCGGPAWKREIVPDHKVCTHSFDKIPDLTAFDASIVRLRRYSRVHRQWFPDAHEVCVVYYFWSAAFHVGLLLSIHGCVRT